MTVTEDRFEAHRAHLLGVAYRLLGSWAESEDVVSEVWLRWREHAAEVTEPRAWLTRVTARAALDVLRSARARRESYVGPWLPEPLVTLPGVATTNDPLERVVQDESVRMAFLVVLEELSPEQRVAVVLHDALGMPFAEVATVLSCTPEAARQHAVRGRRRVADADPPPRTSLDEGAAVLSRLSAALATGDADGLAALLAPGIVFTSDGGGVVHAARRPLVGVTEVAKFLTGLQRLGGDRATLVPVAVNGEPGLLVRISEPRPGEPEVAVYGFGVRNGQVVAVWAVLAPDKLSRLPPTGGAALYARSPTTWT